MINRETSAKATGTLIKLFSLFFPSSTPVSVCLHAYLESICVTKQVAIEGHHL